MATLFRLMPLWLGFALLAAFFRTIKDVYFKKVLDEAYETFQASTLETITVLWWTIFLFVGCWALVRLRQLRREEKPIAVRPAIAGKAILYSGILNVIAYWMFLESLRGGDFSVATALRNTVPLWSLFVGAAFMREKMTALKVLGTGLVVVGTFIIFSQTGEGFVFGESALLYSSALSVGCAMLFVFAAMWDAKGSSTDWGGMNAVVYTASLYGTSVVGFFVLVALTGSFEKMRSIVALWWPYLPAIGIFGTLGSYFTVKAFATAQGILNVVPALRIQVIMSVVAGGLFFEEHGFLWRVLGAVVLTAGIGAVAWKVKPKANKSLAPAKA